MALSAPHIYISVLPILPDDTLVAKKYKKNCGSVLKIKQGNITYWPVQDSLITGHTKAISSVVYSPDGQFIVSGSDDQTVRIWNANSGQSIRQLLVGWHNARQMLGPVTGPSQPVTALFLETSLLWFPQLKNHGLKIRFQ